MSAPEPAGQDTDAGPVIVQPGGIHLLMADTSLEELRREGAYFFTLCGVLLPAAELAPAECPDGCTCEHDRMICPECVRRAAQRSDR